MSSRIRDYRDLVAWQQAVELAVACESVADVLPRRAWHLSSQLRRAANSVHSNIAEGNGRHSLPDYLKHLTIAKASLNEVDSNLHFIARQYPTITGLEDATKRVIRVAKPLGGLIRVLREKARSA